MRNFAANLFFWACARELFYFLQIHGRAGDELDNISKDMQ